MEIAKAVITAAGRNQRTLPLQTLIDRDGEEKSVLRIVIEEVLRAGVEEICLATTPVASTSSPRPRRGAMLTPSTVPATSPVTSPSSTWSATTSMLAAPTEAAPVR